MSGNDNYPDDINQWDWHPDSPNYTPPPCERCGEDFDDCDCCEGCGVPADECDCGWEE